MNCSKCVHYEHYYEFNKFTGVIEEKLECLVEVSHNLGYSNICVYYVPKEEFLSQEEMTI